MAIRTFPNDAADDEIKALVVEWSELLAQKRFEDALKMFLVSDEEEWTPELLEQTIAGYGSPEPYADGRHYEVTTLLGRPDRDEIIQQKMDVDRENLYGLNPEVYVGMVHYDDVPLDGQRSDLTARFHIKRVGSGCLTLEFLDIHVM
jgi:hypothetical protein